MSAGRYRFGPPQSGHGLMNSRDILRGDEKVGYMKYENGPHGQLIVGMVEAHGFRPGQLNGTGGENMLGPVALGHLMKQLKDEGYTTVEGDRYSGARRESDAEGAHMKVDLIKGTSTVVQPRSLELARAFKYRREARARGLLLASSPQPRVPAGESDGGQWTKE